jgi:AraC-like DNA-binding protein
MRASLKRSSRPVPGEPGAARLVPFTEARAWETTGGGWRPLFGSFTQLGFSFEWHDFRLEEQDLDWARSFHPGSVELCLNLEGDGTIQTAQQKVELPPRTLVFYYQGQPALQALRHGHQRHRFITLEFAPEFLVQHFGQQANDLHPLVRAVVRGEAVGANVAVPEPIGMGLLQLVESLRRCPVFKPAQEIWFRCKALELASQLFFSPAGGELLCTRAQRASRERVERARVILKAQMQNPPSLEELGKEVGCSPFYLSRQFSQETGMTIQQYVQQVRMERAAELLRTGRCNVTEAALEVGYSSLSHFSTVFRETFGCCPGLYPLKTPTQKLAP